MRRKFLGTAFLLAILPVAALAQSASPPTAATSETRGKVRAACAADVEKLCPNLERGKGEMRSCLEAHQTQLSDACKAARAERAAARAKDKS